MCLLYCILVFDGTLWRSYGTLLLYLCQWDFVDCGRFEFGRVSKKIKYRDLLQLIGKNDSPPRAAVSKTEGPIPFNQIGLQNRIL